MITYYESQLYFNAFFIIFQNEAASLRAELAALRSAADDAEKAKEGLRSDNTRLTHRISYLEEQVAELLSRHTQVTITMMIINDFFLHLVFKKKKNLYEDQC